MRPCLATIGIGVLSLLFVGIGESTSRADTPSTAPAELHPVRWVGKSADWTDPANWSTGAVPTGDDMAVFDLPASQIVNQPMVKGTVTVGGIDFVSGAGKLKPKLQGDKSGLIRMPPATWEIAGTGTIVLGRGGIACPGTQIIHPGIQLAGPQSWAVGASYLNPTIPETWPDTTGTNPGNLVVCGPITGDGPLTKTGAGKLYYATNTQPTFTGGTAIRGGWISWSPGGLTKLEKFSFGTGPILLDCGYLSFGASMSEDKTGIGELDNPIAVSNRGGRLYYPQEGPTPRTPDTLFAGPIDLGGQVRIGHITVGSVMSNVEVLGPITVDQKTPAVPGLTVSSASTSILFRGPILQGPGDAGNPLLLNSFDCVLELMNPHNTFDGLTVIGMSGPQAFDIISNSSLVDIAANSRLGKGGVAIEPGGRLNLNSAATIPAGAMVTLRSNPLVLGVLGMTYNGVPTISGDSAGVIAVDSPTFDAITDLAKLGDGRMWLGSRDHGTFTGAALAPGAGGVYRLGGGSFGGVAGRGWPKSAFPVQSGSLIGDYIAKDHWLRGNPSIWSAAGNAGSAIGCGLLTVEHGVLVGDAALDVGSLQWQGNIAVVLEGANTFTGPITVAGPMQSGFIIGFCGRGSSLEGVEQTAPGQSPFGSPAGAVQLHNSTLKLTAVPKGQPVAKGELTFGGASAIALDGNIDNLASLTVAKLTRQDRSILVIDAQQEKLGDAERLFVGDMNKDVDLLPPYLLYSSTKGWAPIWGKKNGRTFIADRTTGPDFLAYDATGKTGVTRFAHYTTDLAAAKATDVVKAGATKLPAGEYTVRTLRTTGKIDGPKATIKIASGGLIVNSDFTPNLDFGSAEGIIYATNINSATGGYSAIINLSGKVSGTNGLTMLGGPLPWGYDYAVPAQCGLFLSNPANDFSGAITIEGGALMCIPDSIVKGKVVHGSLGDLNNSITLDGGILSVSLPSHVGGYLAPTRTVRLNSGGGYFHGGYKTWTVDSKITGPGFISQTFEGGGTLILTNPANDYSGGTMVGVAMNIPEAGKLGTGPVTLLGGSSLTLHGDHNIDPSARLTVGNCAVASFDSLQPHIGSLDGSGLVWLGPDATHPPTKLPNSTVALFVGSDNTDSTYFGRIGQAEGTTGSLTKIGTGTFTLYGGHSYTGPTTIDAGTLNLMGGIAGDVIVNKGATLILKGAVTGNVTIRPGGIFHNTGHVGGKITQ